VHVLVEDGQEDKIDLFFVRLALLQPFQNPVTNLAHVRQRLFAGW
jgi:hypothetical protein